MDANVCLVNCSNHGKCKLSDENRFKCECDINYAGSICQADMRPCSSKPCLNNGTCFENIAESSFKCECNQFYFGEKCEFKIDVCKNVTCSFKGNCADVNNKPKCECFYLYSGLRCEIESSEQKIIKNVVSSASIIAIIIIILFYSSFIISDLFDFYIRNKYLNLNDILTLN